MQRLDQNTLLLGYCKVLPECDIRQIQIHAGDDQAP